MFTKLVRKGGVDSFVRVCSGSAHVVLKPRIQLIATKSQAGRAQETSLKRLLRAISVKKWGYWDYYTP